MKMIKSAKWWMVSAALGAALGLGGCDRDANKPSAGDATQNKPQGETPKPATQPIIPVKTVADWCPEHGVPESICTRCNESLVAGFKAKNDWCNEHGLPDSQCFKHHPELKEKFAAEYKKKYGKDAPTEGH